ncbi:MAG: Uma2 family endonuclease [Cyanobacteria bacterium P01_A01_bin.83]
MNTFTLDFQSIELTDEQFYQLCVNNRDLQIERNANGDLIIMPPTGGDTGNKNAGIIAQLWIWNNRDNLGKVFDSSTGFILSNGANRSPDASWIPLSKWDALTEQEQQRFLPLCPDFAVDLLSPRDNLAKTKEKMREYLDNGLRLGWLINPGQQQVEIYRQHQEIEVLNAPSSLWGEDILSGFVLDLESIW